MANIYDFEDAPKSAKSEETPSRSEDAPRKRERESLSPSQLAKGRRTLLQMVETAFNTLERAMESADWPTAIKAAQIVLDRSGFGPKSTVDVNTSAIDLSSLTREELAERAMKVHALLKMRNLEKTAIDVTPNQTIQ